MSDDSISRAVSDSVVYSLCSVLVKGVLVLQVPLFASVLGASDFGLLDLGASFIVLVTFTVALEIAQGVAIYSAEASSKDEVRKFASAALLFSVGAHLAFIVIGLLFASFIADHLLVGFSDELASLVVVTAATQGVFILVHNQFRWILRRSAYFAISVANGAINIVASYAAVTLLDRGVAGIFEAQLFANTVCILLSLWIGRDVFGVVFDEKALKKMLRFSVPLVPSSVSVFLAMCIDRFMINSMMSLEAVGIYGVAFRIAAIVGIVTTGVTGAIPPLIYNLHQESGFKESLERIFRLYLSLGILSAFFFALFGDKIVLLLAGDAFYGSHSPLVILVLAILISSVYVFAPGLILAKRTIVVSVISILGAALNIVLNLVFIPILGVSGSALATLLSGGLVSSLWWKLGTAYYPISTRWISIANSAFVALLVYFIVFLSVGSDGSEWLKLVSWLLTLFLVPCLMFDQKERKAGLSRLMGILK